MSKTCFIRLLYDGKIPSYCKQLGCDATEETAKNKKFACFMPISEGIIKRLDEIKRANEKIEKNSIEVKKHESNK